MQKVTLFIEGNKFEISVQDEHVSRLKAHMLKDLGEGGNNTLKDLLYAYMKKCYEVNIIQTELEGMSKRIDELSKQMK